MFKSSDLLAIFLTFLFILLGSLVSLNRHWQYETFYYDFGIFDQAIWQVAHFKAPIIDHLVVPGKWIFADHFNPSIFLLSPLYWFTSRSEALLIAQAIIVGLSGLVLYFIAIEVLKNKLASLAILISYFLFIGLQNAVITDFHEITVATLPLALTFYSIVKQKLKWFVLFLLLTLGFKESLFILGFAIGIFIILLNRKWWRVGLLTCAGSLIWGFLTIKIIIPYFLGGSYFYSEPLNLSQVFNLFNHPTKINTILNSFLSFSFLPIFSPAYWILIFQDFLTRFYSTLGQTRWGLGLHYSALLSVIMGVGSIYGLKFIISKIKKPILSNGLLILIILNSIFLYRFILHGPFALSYNPAFYKHTNDFKFLDQIVSKVPNPPAGGVSVMAQNNLASHFTHQTVWLLRMNYEKFKPDYILVDARAGQNPNNFFGERNFEVNKFLGKVKEDKCYKETYTTEYQYVFKRNCY